MTRPTRRGMMKTCKAQRVALLGDLVFLEVSVIPKTVSDFSS